MAVVNPFKRDLRIGRAILILIMITVTNLIQKKTDVNRIHRFVSTRKKRQRKTSRAAAMRAKSGGLWPGITCEKARCVLTGKLNGKALRGVNRRSFHRRKRRTTMSAQAIHPLRGNRLKSHDRP